MMATRPLTFWAAWRLALVLGMALLAPAALPAGGGDWRLPELRRREKRSEPLVSDGCLPLLSSPGCQAPALISLEVGVPLRVLRHWLAPDGRRWLQVEASTGRPGPNRGWLAG